MANTVFVGIGPPYVSTCVIGRGNALVNSAGVPAAPDLTEVTSVLWEVKGPTQNMLLPVVITDQTAESISTMRTHQVTDFPAEGSYDMRVRLVLPTGTLYSDWLLIRVRR